MRILIYTSEFPSYSGGIGSFCHTAATGLAELSADVVVLAPTFGAADRDVDNRAPFPVIRIPPTSDRAYAGRAALLRTMLRYRPDVLFVPSGKATRHVARLGPLPGRLVIYLHGTDVYEHFDPLRCSYSIDVRKAVRSLFQSAAAVLAVSHSTAELFQQYYDWHKCRARVVHLGVNVNRLPGAGLAGDGGYSGQCSTSEPGRILCVSRLAPNKGHDMLLEAFDIVRRRIASTGLYFAGDGPCREQLEHLTAKLNLTDHMHFLGDLGPEQLAEQFQKCALFSMISRRGPAESFGTVYLEANAFGKPSVAGRTGGVAEVVQDGQTGLLVDPCDPPQIAHAIVELLRDPARLRSMGEAARRRVFDQFTHRHLAQNLLDVFQSDTSRTRRADVTFWAGRKLAEQHLRRLVARSMRRVRKLNRSRG